MKRFSLAFGAALIFVGCAHRAPVKKGDLIVIEGKAANIEPLPADAPILVGLRVEAKEVEIHTDADFTTERLSDKKKATWHKGYHRLNAKKLKKEKLRLKISVEGHYFQVGTNQYRGDLIVIPAADGKVTVINELRIDDYLKGVLPREAIVTWPDEALRVQAVASRTYLASHLGKHKAQGFDLCSEVHCQVYGGMTKEHPKTNEAVATTKGEILTYNDKPIGAYFHANCGGSTEKIKAVWGNDDVPYLPCKKCDYGSDNPRQVWRLSLHDTDIYKALKKADLIKGSRVEDVSVKKKSASGRAEIVTVLTDAGPFDMRGNAFRIALHPEKIRSTLWDRLNKKDGIYEFEGRGWGHGVGMCQWGARGQSDRGRNYREILEFYYPNTLLTQWKR